MLPKRFGLISVMCAVCVGAGGSVLSPEPAAATPPGSATETTPEKQTAGNGPISVALTMTKPANAAKDQQLAENLLDLVGLAIQAETALAVVERREIDRAIQELLLDQSRAGNPQLELGN